MSSSLCDASGLNRLHKSMVNNVLELLNMDVKELMIADIITAMSKPLKPIIERKVQNETSKC